MKQYYVLPCGCCKLGCVCKEHENKFIGVFAQKCTTHANQNPPKNSLINPRATFPWPGFNLIGYP